MVNIIIKERRGVILGFLCEGHSGYAPEGEDIVCASVSAVAQFVIAGICETLEQSAEYSTEKGRIELSLNENAAAQSFLRTFKTFIGQLAAQYKDYINFSILEV